jgi:hypothetical protein
MWKFTVTRFLLANNFSCLLIVRHFTQHCTKLVTEGKDIFSDFLPALPKDTEPSIRYIAKKGLRKPNWYTVWWLDATLFDLFLLFSIETFSFDNTWITIVEAHYNIILHCCCSEEGYPWEGRAGKRTRAYRIANRRTNIWATPHPIWATLHTNWAMTHPIDLRRTLFELLRLLEKV